MAARVFWVFLLSAVTASLVLTTFGLVRMGDDFPMLPLLLFMGSLALVLLGGFLAKAEKLPSMDALVSAFIPLAMLLQGARNLRGPEAIALWTVAILICLWLWVSTFMAWRS